SAVFGAHQAHFGYVLFDQEWLPPSWWVRELFLVYRSRLRKENKVDSGNNTIEIVSFFGV
ncbi:MAG: hypothetical protein QXI12_08630, partial [Candidatus Methanomethyliaceae archaeon]